VAHPSPTDSPRLHLASRSPRRRELLDQMGLCYRVVDVAIDEATRVSESAHDYVLRVAHAKATRAHAALPADALVLAADTSVVLDGDILGKPDNAEHALRMLRSLAGKTHQVMTGVALSANTCTTCVSVSTVRFRAIGDDELRAYIATGEPLDKAGAYAIQGRAAVFIEHLQGSYSGVMGLPIFEVAQLLEPYRL
jgi:septum formation protein